MTPRHDPPAGDIDLTGGRPGTDEVIADGGAGPSGSDATSTGALGGMGNTSDGVASRRTRMSDDNDAGLPASVDAIQERLGDVVGASISDGDGSALD